MTKEEINGEYEKETGKVIIETFNGVDPMLIPAALVKNHGVFSWGEMQTWQCIMPLYLKKYQTLSLNLSVGKIQKELLDKHYLRKHGADAYYGQDKK